MEAEVILLSDDETVVRAASPPLEMPDIEILREVTHAAIRNGRSSSTSSEEGREIEAILRDPLSPLSESEMHNLDRGRKSSSGHCNLPSTSGTSFWGKTVVRTSFSQPAISAGVTENSSASDRAHDELISSGYRYEGAVQSACLVSTVRYSSDDSVLTRKKRKRTREELGEEKLLKEAERERKAVERKRNEVLKREARDRKVEERVQKKKETELAKQISKFQREVSSSKKSKCEKNLFCLVDGDLLASFAGLEETLRQVFNDRNIGEQLVVEPEASMKVCWKRRSLDADIREGKLIREEELIYERFCIYFLTADAFKELCQTKRFLEFMNARSKTLPFASPRITVVIHGIRPDSRVTNLLLEAYEEHQTQLRFVNSVYEMASLIARMHRSVAKLEKLVESQMKLLFDTEKGVKEGPELVVDWWSKMLKHMLRLGGEQLRTIAKNFPDPFALAETLDAMDARDALQLIAETTTEEGRRIGPVLAQKLFFVLTSRDGAEVIDE